MFKSIQKFLAAGAVLAALALGASALAGAASSSTTTTSTAPSAPPGGPSSTQPPPRFSGPAHGTAAHEDAEKAVTGAAATKAQEAAVKSVGSGKAGSVSTDYSQSGYEVTVTKSDGSQVEVHLDSSFNAMAGPPGGAPPRPGISG